MKETSRFTRWPVLLIAGLALAGSTSLGLAQNLPLTYPFDTGANSWIPLWYGSSSSVHWDGSLDANDNPNSGSVRAESAMNGDWGGCWGCVEDGWGWDQNIVIDNSAGIAASLSCDIRVDPSSPLTTEGDYGWWHLGLESNNPWGPTDLGQFWMPPTATNWTHVSLPITAGNPQNFFGYTISVYGANYTNSLKFNVDNVVLAPAVAPAQVQLLNPAYYSGGVFQFTVTNLAVGTSYTVQASTDLVQWAEVTTFTASDTSVGMSDNTAGSMQKFYRVQTP